jgi:hypothetical protein
MFVLGKTHDYRAKDGPDKRQAFEFPGNRALAEAKRGLWTSS